MMIDPQVIQSARDKSIMQAAQACGASIGGQGGLHKAGLEWNGPCPACGGKDRFWVDEQKNVFLCRASGAAGDAIELVKHKHGCSFAEAVEMLSGMRSMPQAERVKQSDDDSAAYREKARHRAFEIWKGGRPASHLVEAYFERRGIRFPDWRPRTLRETPRLKFWHRSKSDKTGKIIHEGPAMLAAITGPDGRFMGVHRTWLDLDHPSGKAVIADPETGEVLNSKKVEGSQRGGMIVLRDGGPDRAMGEGIETVVSWAQYRGDASSALICGINLDNIAGKAASQIPHPSLTVTDRLGRTRRVKIGGHEPDPEDTSCLRLPQTRRLVLIGDGDSDRYTTQAAMMRAQKRHASDCHDATIDWADDGLDFNTMLKSRARSGAAA